MKIVCTKCKRELSIKWFSKDKTKKSGYHPHCKTCRRVYGSVWQKLVRKIPEVGDKWRKQNRESYSKHREKRRDEMRKRTPEYKTSGVMKSLYGITLDQYNEMLKKQDGGCAICGKTETRKNMWGTGICRLNIDHDHNTGEVRGLLCHSCNFGLGAFFDSAQLLSKAIEYLQKGGDDL